MNCTELKVKVTHGGSHKMAPLIGKNNNIMNRKLKVDRDNNFRSPLTTPEDIAADETVLQRFYSGSHVFVTGATGFMGKVLIEKLLRSCPDIQHIYIMVREKKGRSMEDRIDDLVSSPCFDRIKEEAPKFRSKLSAVAGDIGVEGLGMTEADRRFLQEKVEIVFHVAATVNFDEKLKTAILQNVRGTREMMSLCRSFTRLKALVHVSTMYSNCPLSQVDERLYDSPLSCEKAIQMAETMDVEVLEQLCPTLIGEWPNSYVFTKAISEEAVKTFGQGLPVTIFRPSIVVSTKAEPMSGWIDNLYGPTGVIAGVTAGLLRTLQVRADCQANIVPCDMVINAMIASAWDVGSNRQKEMPVYNYISPEENPWTWRQFTDTYIRYGEVNPTVKCIWYWTITLTTSRLLYLTLCFLLHILPALLMDLALVLTNNKPQLVRAYNKIHKFAEVITYFSTKHWRFGDQNIMDLWDRLDSRDQEMFFFDMRSLDWEEYTRETCAGLREYLLKDTVDTIPAARTRYRRLYILHCVTRLVFLSLFVWLSYVLCSRLLSSVL